MVTKWGGSGRELRGNDGEVGCEWEGSNEVERKWADVGSGDDVRGEW